MARLSGTEREETQTDRKTHWQKVLVVWTVSGLRKKTSCEQKQINYCVLLRRNKHPAGDTAVVGEKFVKVPTTKARLFVRPDPTGLRKQLDGLAVLVGQQVQMALLW